MSWFIKEKKRKGELCGDTSIGTSRGARSIWVDLHVLLGSAGHLLSCFLSVCAHVDQKEPSRAPTPPGGLYTHSVDCRQFQLFKLGFLLDVGGKITPHFVCVFLALKAQENIRQRGKFSVGSPKHTLVL